VAANEGMWQGDSLAPMAAMALAAIDRRIAADHQRLLNEALIIDDDREVILQEIVLPTLLLGFDLPVTGLPKKVGEGRTRGNFPVFSGFSR
jgi:hypothetical protein